MSVILKSLVSKEDNIILYDEYASFEQAAELAHELEHKLDAIISRGSTAAYIQAAVDIPVISIPISPFDLTQSLHNLPQKDKEIAFFNYSRNIFGVREIESMFGIKIREYTFVNKADIEDNIKDCVANNINTVIGGAVARELANKYSLVGVEISSGEESIYRALKEALQLVEVKRKEKNNSTRLEVAFDSLNEGILVTDNQNDVLVCNSSFKRIINSSMNTVKCNDDSKNCMNKDLSNSCTSIVTSFFKGKNYINHIEKINGTMVNINKYPVSIADEKIGTVFTVEDVTKIISLENQIRNKLYTKGFVAKYTFHDIKNSISNEKMNYLKEIAKFYAKTNSSILIYGESGTGKEMFAQSIHNESNCAKGPFVALNCAAIPENLIESELFGYEAGSFSGASKEGKKGLFELAP